MIHKVTISELQADDNTGRCDACGEEAYGVEPDARYYTCEVCGEDKVFGLAELLMMNQVEIVDDE